MPSLKELRERAGEVVNEMKRLRDDYNADKAKRAADPSVNPWDDNREKRWEELNEEHDRLRSEIDREKRCEDLDKQIAEIERESGQRDNREHRNVPGRDDFRGGRPGGGGQPDEFRDREAFIEQRDLAIAAWAGHGRSDRAATPEAIQACKRFGINPANNALEFDLYDTRDFSRLQRAFRAMHPSLIEERSLSAHLGASGGHLIGSTLAGSLERNMLAFGGIEQVAEVMVTETGDEMSWPTADDTGNEGAIVGENPSSADTADPSFAAVKWYAHEFTSKLVKVSVRLMEDAPSYLAGALGEMLGERLGRAKNRKFTTGVGGNEPKGLVTAATLGKTAASATAIDADEVKDLEHSIDPAYRSDPSFGFMCHDNILLHLRKLKDGNSRYLWDSGLQDGRPDTLSGRVLHINQHMDSAVATTNKTLLCGQFRKYKVRRVRRVRLLRLDERFAELSQVGFIAFERADGNLLDAGTAPVKYLQQA